MHRSESTFLGAISATVLAAATVSAVAAADGAESSGIATSVVNAPIVADGDVAGAPADFVINLDSNMDPSFPGRTLLAGNTIRITLPAAFESAGLPADMPTACSAFAGECNTAVLLQGWPQRPFPPTNEFYTLEMDGTHTLVFTAVQDLAPGATPGIKQSHLMALGFTNPEAGDYPIEIEAQTGPEGAVETGTAVVTIHPEIRPSINVTSVFAKAAEDGPNGNTIYQQTTPGQSPAFAWDFLLFGADGDGIIGAELVQTGDAGGDIVVGDETIGSYRIEAPEGATGQSVGAEPSVAFEAPVSGAPTGRLTAVFTAGDMPGTYVTTFELDGGTSQQMFVEVAEQAIRTHDLPHPRGMVRQVPTPSPEPRACYSGTPTIAPSRSLRRVLPAVARHPTAPTPMCRDRAGPGHGGAECPSED
jgi:hypothetical protein